MVITSPVSSSVNSVPISTTVPSSAAASPSSSPAPSSSSVASSSSCAPSSPLAASSEASSSELTSVLLSAPDRKSTRLNSSHVAISYAVFCLKKKTTKKQQVESAHHKASATRVT